MPGVYSVLSDRGNDFVRSPGNGKPDTVEFSAERLEIFIHEAAEYHPRSDLLIADEVFGIGERCEKTVHGSGRCGGGSMGNNHEPREQRLSP